MSNSEISRSQASSGEPILCKYCHEMIARDAKMCRHCRLYQSAFRNWLPLLGAGVAILTFLIASGPRVFDILWGEPEATVVTVTWPDQLAVLNSGEGGILVESLEISSDDLMNGTFRFYYPIYRRVEEGGLERIDFEHLFGLTGGGPVLANISGKEWGDMVEFPIKDGEHFPQFYEKGSKNLTNIKKDVGTGLRTFQGTGVLTYRSVGNPKKLTAKVDLEGVFIGDKSRP